MSVPLPPSARAPVWAWHLTGPHKRDFPQRALGISPSTHVCRCPGPRHTRVLDPKHKENNRAVGAQQGLPHPLPWAPVSRSQARVVLLPLTSCRLVKREARRSHSDHGENKKQKASTQSVPNSPKTNAMAIRRASRPYSDTMTFTLHRCLTQVCVFLAVPG